MQLSTMEVSEQELRSLVREAVARHLARATADPACLPSPSAARGVLRSHASHFRLVLSSGGDADGACLIEPTTRCTHCGYCQSLGH